MKPAIFLDRDGVINENRPDHVKSWAEFQFIPGVFQALNALHKAGWHAFVITNQAIINRRVVSPSIVDDIHLRMCHLIEQHGGYIYEASYCPHDYGEQCDCRKPQPGQMLRLAQKWQIDLHRSFVIGDALTDMATAQAAKCHSIMVRTGRGNTQLQLPERPQYQIDFIANDLSHAVQWLLTHEQQYSI